MDHGSPDPSQPPRTLSDALTEQFYAWERRGRGWDLFEYPVLLEPPFRPFVRYDPTERRIDDGRRPGLLETLARSLAGRLRSPTDTASIELEEPEPDVDTRWSELIELQLRIPEHIETGRELAERLLSSLLAFQTRLSFELLGIGSEVFLQLAIAEEHVAGARAALQAFVPDVAIATVPTLSAAWRMNADDQTAIVDFGLDAEFVLPITVSASLATDPLLSFVAALETLAQHELGLLQILIEPASAPWPEHALAALTDGGGGAFFSDAPQLLPLAREKLSSPLVCCVIRTAARARDTARAWAIARQLAGGLDQFARPMSNRFIPLSNAHYPDGEHEVNLLDRQSHRTGMLLSTRELVGLVHLPTRSVKSDQLRATPARTKAAPSDVATGDVSIGTNCHRGRERSVHLDLETRLRHVHVVGATGTGKSTLLASLMEQDIDAGRGFALLDPHGDLADEILAFIPRERHDDVLLFDPSDEEYPVGFNVLAARTDREKELLASDLVAIFRRYATSWGDQMTAVMSNAVLAFLDSDVPGTLLDLRYFLRDRATRDRVLASVTDPLVAGFWRDEFSRLSGERSVMPIVNRLDAFLRPKTIRNVVAQPGADLDLAGLMDEGRIFIAKLSQGAIGEVNAHLLGSLLVAKFQQATLTPPCVRACVRDAALRR